MADRRQFLLVSEVGRALFGDRWPRELPKALHLDERDDGAWELDQWASGAPVPKGELDDMLRLVTARLDALQRVFVEVQHEIADARWRGQPAIPRRRWG
jgi:hypothetical protein